MSDYSIAAILVLAMIPITIFLKKFFSGLEESAEDKSDENKRQKP